MEFLGVIVAGAACFALGGLWYGLLGRAWLAASGVPVAEDGQPANRKDPVPYVTAFLCAVLVAGMMRHVFGTSGIDGPGTGLLSGLGIGVFVVCPWLATCYGFAARPRRLLWIDGGYAALGCGVIGLVLGLF